MVATKVHHGRFSAILIIIVILLLIVFLSHLREIQTERSWSAAVHAEWRRCPSIAIRVTIVIRDVTNSLFVGRRWPTVSLIVVLTRKETVGHIVPANRLSSFGHHRESFLLLGLLVVWIRVDCNVACLFFKVDALSFL